jgi:EmrB/QacA subfamily drug resistance transporter
MALLEADQTNPALPATRRRAILISMSAAVIVVIGMQAAINLAVPGLASGGLHPSASELVWLVDAYTIVFASLLIPGGAAGDRFGRRRVVCAGLAMFAVGCGVCAVATGVPVFLAGRALTGLGAAATLPNTLAVLLAVFPPQERRAAIATWSSMTGVAGVFGNIGAGVILQLTDPTGLFVVFAVLAAVVLAATAWCTPSIPAHRHRLDPIGTVLLIVALVSVLDAIIEAPTHGWGSGLVLGELAAGVALLAVFVGYELRRAEPMLDPRIFKIGAVSLACVLVALLYVGMFGLFYVNAQYLEQAKGYDLLTTGLAIAPMAVGIFVAARYSMRVGARIGYAAAVCLGLVVTAAGLFGFSTVSASTPYPLYIVYLLVLAAGFGTTLPIVSAAIVTATPARLAGLGSGLQGATRELGSALGIAIVGTVLTASFASHAPATLHAGPHPNPSEVLARAAGGPLHAAAVHAYTGAVDDSIRAVALAVLAGAVLTAVVGRRVLRA